MIDVHQNVVFEMGKNRSRARVTDNRCKPLVAHIRWSILFLWEWKRLQSKICICYSGYQSHAPSNDFFAISKTTFWWMSIKCIHDNNGERSFWNHYFNVNSQSIRVALSSVTWLVDKQKLRNKTYKIVWSTFSFVSLTGNVLKLQIYKQCTTTTTWDWTKYK